MKKKIVISNLFCLILIVIVTGFIIWNNRVVTTITLDINPSIEINLGKKDKIKNVIALNEDAKEIVNNSLKGKSLDDVLNSITDKLIEKEYVAGDYLLDIILYSEGNISNKEIKDRLGDIFHKKDISFEMITIKKITSEDKKLAKKFNISPAKIAYIKQLSKKNKNIRLENFANKSVSEIRETHKTGKYCEKDYILEGDWCLKEKERIQATKGEICPRGYNELNGVCYEEISAVEGNNYICDEGFNLSNNKCILDHIYDATGKCDKGEFRDGYCIIKEYYGDAKEYCRLTPETDLLYNGRCLGRKPPINGGCLNGDSLINGYCYDTSPSSGYKADWVCPDGTFISNPDGSLMNGDKKCYRENKTNPTSYYCEDKGKLNGTKCEYRETVDARKEKICPSGYTPVDDGSRCLNLNKIANKENGFICEGEYARLKGKTCIIYEAVEAKS